MIYTQEQLMEFAKKISLFGSLGDVLKALDEEGLRVKDIGERTNQGAYPRDKAILALEFSGFITKRESSVSKIYTITKEGKELLMVISNLK